MSTWIHVTNLPLYYDEYGLQDIFGDIGQIIAMNVTKNEMILKSTGFVQFSNPKHAKLAASKKDQTVIGNSAIRVYLIWTPKEDLSTIKVENIPLNITTIDLENNFEPYGQIVDIRIHKNTLKNDEKQDATNSNAYALISYCRVDYALQAVQEMNNTILDYGSLLIVNLVNPDARNLKWKRNSFEYKIIDIPPITPINFNNNHRKHHHNNHRHHHHNRNNNNSQSHHQSNPNIIIVNNIGSIHNNTNDDMKNDELLHPTYPYNKHAHNNNRKRYNRNNNRQKHNNNYEDDNNNNYHHRHHYRNKHNNNKRHSRKQRQFRNNQYNNYNHNNNRNNTYTQSTLLGPLHNESNGHFRSYSVTPSPTVNDSNHLNISQVSLQRMNSADSNSSNSSAQSLPNNYGQRHNHNNSNNTRGALESYGFPSKQRQQHQHQTHHSPQPVSYNNINNAPVSPASTNVSTPSTTHSMPTPNGGNCNGLSTPPTMNSYNLIHRSKTPTPIFGTPTKSSTTPISNIGRLTPPLPTVPIPQIIPNMNNMNNMNIINGMNAMTINNINNINNMGMISPTSLMFPQLDTINNNNIINDKSPQSQTSPIVITPSQHNLLLQQQQINNINQIKNINQSQSLSPPNQSNFLFNSSPTLQGPFNTPPFNTSIQPSKRFVFNNSTNNSNNIPESQKSSKTKKHSWTPKEEQLGNKLYQMLKNNYPSRATKIVGMLLTANTIKDIEWMIQKPHILMAVANDYNQKQQKKELNKK